MMKYLLFVVVKHKIYIWDFCFNGEIEKLQESSKILKSLGNFAANWQCDLRINCSNS